MLKIKDNVDLKELEKYGRIKKEYNSSNGKIDTLTMYGRKLGGALIFKRRKGLCFKQHYIWNDNEHYNIVLRLCTRLDEYDYDNSYKFIKNIDEDLLYKLIQDGLVEKV